MVGKNEAQSMINLIRELIILLSQDTLGVEDIAARIGPVIRNPGISMALEMQPAAGMRSARLSRDPETGIPYVLTIEPEPDVRPAVAELKAAFGDYRRARTSFEQPATIVFYPAMAGSWAVAVIVELEPSVDPVEDRSVERIRLRRDPINRDD